MRMTMAKTEITELPVPRCQSPPKESRPIWRRQGVSGRSLHRDKTSSTPSLGAIGEGGVSTNHDHACTAPTTGFIMSRRRRARQRSAKRGVSVPRRRRPVQPSAVDRRSKDCCALPSRPRISFGGQQSPAGIEVA